MPFLARFKRRLVTRLVDSWYGGRGATPGKPSPGKEGQSQGQAVSAAGQGPWDWRGSLRYCLLLLPLPLPLPLLGAVAYGAEVTQAIELYRTGQYEECRQLCHEAIEGGEYSETWRLWKVRAELACGRYPESLATLEAALQRFTTSVRLRWLGVTVCRFNGDVARAQRLLQEIDQLVSGNPWRYSDPANRVTLGRYYLQRGIDPKQVLDATFHAAKKQQADFVEAYLAAGQLALEKHDYALAAEEFGKALKFDATDPDIHFGLARSFQPSDDEKSTEQLQAALRRNPRHVDSLLLAVDSHIDAERYAEARELIRQILAIHPLDPRAWAYRAVVAHLHSDVREESVSRQMALAWWSANPEVDHLIGRKLSQKYRFREGAACQRLALSYDGHYLPAKVQLSEDLLRLGEEIEGWRLAQEVFDADAYNVVAHNLTTLRDHLAKFRTLTADGFVVLMDAREADIYGPRVLALLQRARETLLKKYDVQLDRPTLVEIFPEQQDFAIRTFGLPGGDGFLGVCFGNVITANSPASRGENPVSWESVLWHEFCHVVTLNKTLNKMPRWLSEGISVYEERQADPSWGESLTPAYRDMILGEDLTPVSALSGAFLNARSPLHLQFAYYESSLVVEYLVERYGEEILSRILVDLGAGMPINESLQRYTGSLAALDQEFAEYARQRARAFAPQADWSKPDLPATASLAEVATWLMKHPDNMDALSRHAELLIEARQWEQAAVVVRRKLELVPRDEHSHAQLASIYRQQQAPDKELEILEKWSQISSDAVPAYLRLLELHTAAGNWEGVRRAAERLLASNPLLPAPHRAVAQAAEATGDIDAAIAALTTILRMSPLDEVSVHFRLARLLQQKGDLLAAKRHVLQALEEAPRFREGYDALRSITAALQQLRPAAPAPAGPVPEKPVPEKPDAEELPAAPEKAARSEPASGTVSEGGASRRPSIGPDFVVLSHLPGGAGGRDGGRQSWEEVRAGDGRGRGMWVMVATTFGLAGEARLTRRLPGEGSGIGNTPADLQGNDLQGNFGEGPGTPGTSAGRRC